MLIKARELKPNDQFIIAGPRMRKLHHVKHIWDTDEASAPKWHGGVVPESVKDKVLLILHGCRQMILKPDQDVKLMYRNSEESN